MSDKEIAYYLDQIDDYLNGKLSAVDRAAFHKAKDKYPKLSQDIDAHLLSRRLIREEGEKELKAKFKQAFKETETSQARPEAPRGLANNVVWPYALLLFIALGLIGYYFRGMQQSEISTGEIKQEPILMAELDDPSYDLLRSGAVLAAEDQWQKAVSAFSQRDYQSALTILQSLPSDKDFLQKYAGKYHLMKGVTNLRLKNFADAETALQMIESTNPYYDQAEWYLAVTAYFSGDSATATSRLKVLSSRDQYYRQAEAGRYLSQLQGK